MCYNIRICNKNRYLLSLFYVVFVNLVFILIDYTKSNMFDTALSDKPTQKTSKRLQTKRKDRE